MSDILTLLEENGIKKTKQRITLIHELGVATLPVTAEQLYVKHSDMSLSTIYRTLELFCEKGIAKKSNINESDCYYYELTRSKHKHYAVCLGCQNIFYLESCPLYNIDIDMGEFEVTSHKLELYGYCKDCIKDKK